MTQNNDNIFAAIFLTKILMPALTENQFLIFWFINKYYAEHKKKPKNKEIAKGLRFSPGYISREHRKLIRKLTSLQDPEMSKLLLGDDTSKQEMLTERSEEWTKKEAREITELTDNPDDYPERHSMTQ